MIFLIDGRKATRDEVKRYNRVNFILHNDSFLSDEQWFSLCDDIYDIINDADDEALSRVKKLAKELSISVEDILLWYKIDTIDEDDAMMYNMK